LKLAVLLAMSLLLALAPQPAVADGPFRVFFPIGEGGQQRVQLGMWINGDAQREAVAAQYGARWGFLRVLWKEIEPVRTNPRTYNWSKVDAELARAKASGLLLIALVADNPEWAATYSGGKVDKADPELLFEFVRAAAARFGAIEHGVRYWQLYNEPDNAYQSLAELGFGYWGNDPAGYVEYQRRFTQAVKSAAPRALVTNGGLALDWFNSEGGPFADDFLDRFIALGGARHIDALDFHYYGLFDYRWDTYGKGVLGKLAFARGILAKHGVTLPVISTEIGFRAWPSHPQRARDVATIMTRSAAGGMQVALWFLQADEGTIGDVGLFTGDAAWIARPAATAYKTAANHLHDTRVLGALATTDQAVEGHRFARADGATVLVAWRASAGAISVPGKLVSAVNHLGQPAAAVQLLNSVHVPVGPDPVFVVVR
jgi:hypothetical protein